MFLKNCWYVAAWESEIPPSTPIARHIAGEPIVLFRGQDGTVAALADRCPHRHAPLSLGRIEGSALRCMYHGLLFDRSGACLQVPGTDIIPPNCSARSYPIVVQDSWVWVWMGEPARANAALIPKAFGLDNPRIVMRADQIDYEANYMLINDNLCDLSHVDFVHETTLGHVTGGGWSQSVPRVRASKRGIRVERWFEAKPASPSNPTLVDTWSTYDFLAPGIFLMENRSYSHGMARKLDFAEPTDEPMTYRVEQQAVTPISEDRTRYFFSSGFDSRIPARLLDDIFGVVMAAFAEDRVMIEAQQRIWDVTAPDEPMAFVVQDKGPAMFRRIMDRLLMSDHQSS